MSKYGVGRRTLKRSSIVAFALLLVFLFLVLRVFAIQVFDFSRYQQKVIDQLTTESPVRAARGEILDAAGRVLAANRTVYRISLFPNVVAKKNDPRLAELLATGLAEAIPDISAEKVREHLSHTSELERTVARAVELDVAQAVLDFVEREALYDTVAVEAISTRYYPYGDLASHLLGFTGSDGQGLYGIELQYDSALAGKNGSYITARDSFGNEMPNAYEAYVPATDGCTLVTTIDAYVQAVLEEQLRATMTESGAANRVAGIVMDVNTGAILAMATAPSFDLNAPFSLNEACKAELAALGLVEGTEEYTAAKSRLLLHIEQLRRLSVFNLESIF